MKLSAPQKNVLETELYFKNTSTQNIGGYILFEKKVKYELLDKAVNKLLENADALRLKVTNDSNNITQEIVPYKYEKLENVGAIKDLDGQNEEWMKTPFDIYDKLYEFKYFEFNGKSGLLVKIHHLASDAWSIAIIVSKIIEYYDIYLNQKEVQDELPSYTLFLDDEEKYLNSEKHKKDEEYWKNKYADKPVFVSLARNATTSSPIGNRLSFTIGKSLRQQIENYCQENSISITVFFEAIISLYGARTNNQDEITLCSMGLNRSGKTLKSVVGNFSNILPMLVKINWNDGFLKLCKNIASEHFELFRHQDYPYQDIMKNMAEKFGTTNIYDIMVSYQNAKYDENEETKYTTKWVFNGYSELNFMFNIDDMQNTGEFNINIDYRLEAFYERDIINIYDRLMHIAQQILDLYTNKKEDIIFKDVEIVTKKEKETILKTFNDTNKTYPKDMLVFENLEKNAEKNPTKPALYFEGDMITYGEFNKKVNSLAHAIIEAKVGQNNIIGIMFERSFDMLIAIYAVVKSGNTYMPIDPHFPQDRIAFMLEDSKAPIILTNTKHKESLSAIPEENKKSCKIIYLDSFEYEKYSDENPNLKISPMDTAYCIYTSGSTGKPKGAVIRHHSIINRIFWMHDKYELKEDDVILQKTPYTFDVSVWELFWWSLKNASLRILIPEGHKDPEAIVDAIYESKVTHIHFVPSMLNAFLEYIASHKNDIEKLKSLKFVFASGEALQCEHVKKFYNLLGKNNTTLHNLYGPTECTVDVSYYDCDKENIPESIPIGKPVDNTQLIILDKACNLMPIGVPGELHISGDLVGNGYINRDELTKEKFIKNTFYNYPTMYKTGDLCSWDEDGNIEYLGRMDNQVKIRGLRVELGDIENAILKDNNISECVVTVVEFSGEKYLCAYYSCTSKVEEKDINLRISKDLPEYMIPTYYVELPKLPLNANGKIDRKSLPLPNFEKDEEYIAPENEIEEKISKCVCKVLKREKISVLADLLTYGLTSLSAIILLTELSNNGIEIKVKDLYANKNIRSLANMINSSTFTEDDYSDDESYRDISDIAKIESTFKDSGDILLTGSTGFLGIHLLAELYNQYPDRKIYCIIRNAPKFEEFLIKYTTIGLNDERIITIRGDITKNNLGLDKQLYNKLTNSISEIYHSAANVSFFCPWEESEKINYYGTVNLVDFALKANAKLHHMSTISVSGDILTTQKVKNPKFSENTLYVGQRYKENVYVYSKYLAEKCIIDNIRKHKLSANIYRPPNITWRASDGLFQSNFKQNDLYMLTNVMYYFKAVPSELKDELFYLTPVDDLAKAIVILGANEKGNHAYNLIDDSSPSIDKYMNALEKMQYDPIASLYEKARSDVTNSDMQFASMYLTGLLKNPKGLMVNINYSKTSEALANNKFSWHKITNDYIKYWLNIK